MLILKNHELSIRILDPNEDHAYFGTRYCTGGYIYQIDDARIGPILSGPTYPDEYNTYDGQGIPDSFNHCPLRDPFERSDEALLPGIGICDLVKNTVTEFTRWDIEKDSSKIDFRTIQQYQQFKIELRRCIELQDRSVSSITHIVNRSSRFIPISWFPHPFFPQPKGAELCALGIPHGMPENPGYELGNNGFIRRKEQPEKEGRFQSLPHQASAPLVILQKHDLLGIIAAKTSYIPSYFPIWGNTSTFSWEPYFERTVASGEEIQWSVVYHF